MPALLGTLSLALALAQALLLGPNHAPNQFAQSK